MCDLALELRALSKHFSAQPPVPSARGQELGPKMKQAHERALNSVSVAVPVGSICGVVGPDGAGKTTLLRLMAGLMLPSSGEVLVFGQPAANITESGQVGYMPQKFGLYEDLSVIDNLELHAHLRGLHGQEKKEVFDRLLQFTDLRRFTTRLTGKLSGGMKQKLGLACALLGTPRLLLLDEPGVGVDPLSRRELWRMVTELAQDGMTVVWSTAYMDEAERCDPVIMLDSGHVIHAGPPQTFLDKVQGRTFILNQSHAMLTDRLPEKEKLDSHLNPVRESWRYWSLDPRVADIQPQGESLRFLLKAGSVPDATFQPTPPKLEDAYMDAVEGAGGQPSPFALFPSLWERQRQDEYVIRAEGLTQCFGNFTAASNITFNVGPGKIFGLLGPNGAGKSTTFRMLCGLSRPTEGQCFVDGVNLRTSSSKARNRLGYMAQKFSLYGDLTVSQNIQFFAELYGIAPREAKARADMLLHALQLENYVNTSTQTLPLGQKQCLSLICATLHGPSALFLDEPTSGVDPRTRREFWKHINALTSIGVSVLVTTHFMEEAEYCDDLVLVYHGHIIARGTPDTLRQACPADQAPTLENAFITCVERYDREHPL